MLESMLDSNARLFEIARSKRAQRPGKSGLPDYEEAAELFRRITDLDARSFGPELARFENAARPAPPRALRTGGKFQYWFFRLVNPVMGRLLRAASLATPFRASYDLSIHLHEQQLATERKILAEIAAISARLELLEAEIRSRR